MGLTLLIDTYDTEEGARKVVALAPRLRQAGVAVRGVHPRDHQSFASAHLGRAAYDTITLPYGEQILWPDHCVQGTAGADFHPELEVARRRGFEVVVIEDACRALDVEGSAESARRRLEISGARLASSWDVSRPMAPA
ncbi:MAG: hypothetical protein WCY15_14735 [Phenylobacterium sp.]|jgi:nicotinamidase-related amidase|uniref:hypothetical protein n=1 Tax=Phenylobacterium sp. TaxID=1871053 RepID=UPI002A35AAAD|nr:hypothetical protein [Phenylobacterium sp.]MDX9999544.1 hypothetical protein [Phenylobacterium sp.]